MRLIILGPPGSGKGSQSALLSDKFGIPAISVGALLREEVSHNTELGRISKGYMERGEWVPHEVTFRVLANRLAWGDVQDGFVIDAFPRLSAEYHQLGTLLVEKGWELDCVFNLEVSDIECLRRIKARALIQKTKGVYRPDNDEKVILQRLSIHHQTSQQILNYYKESGVLVNIDGSDTISSINKKIVRELTGRKLI